VINGFCRPSQESQKHENLETTTRQRHRGVCLLLVMRAGEVAQIGIEKETRNEPKASLSFVLLGTDNTEATPLTNRRHSTPLALLNRLLV